MISTSRNSTAWKPSLPVATLIAALLVSAACRPDSDDELSVPAELADLEGVQQVENEVAAGEAEEELRLQEAARQEELRVADLALQEREAQLREERRLFEEHQAVALEKEQMAARQAEIERREREMEERSKELAVREADLAAAERSKVLPLEEVLPLEASEEVAVLAELDEEPYVARAPRFVETSLEVGTVLEVELLQTLSSRTAQVGDTFSSRVARDIFSADGILVVPAGSEVIGRVTEARALRRVGGQASLGVEMRELILPSGHSIGIHASMLELGRDKRKDKRKILVAAAAGAILGRILGNDGGSALAGAAVGAAAGTAVAARAKGVNVDLPAGEIVAFRLEEVVTVTTEMTGLAPQPTDD